MVTDVDEVTSVCLLSGGLKSEIQHNATSAIQKKEQIN